MRLGALFAFAFLGCSMGGSPGGFDLSMSSPDLAMPDLVMAAITVPDPGMMSDFSNSRNDVEPNDTAQTAQPIGIMNDLGGGETSIYIGISGPQPRIGGADKADWFVFRAGPGVTSLGFFMCWANNPVNLMDFHVYDVTGGMLGAEVGGSEETNTDCENQARAPVPLTAGQVYALEMRNIEGMGTYYS